MGKKERGRKWDGKSRVSTDLYRKRYNEIFKKMTKTQAINETVPLTEDEEYLKELKDKL